MGRRGFTLIEVLIFTAMFAIVMAGVVTMLVAVTRVQSGQTSAYDVESQGQVVIQQIQYYVSSARLIDLPLGTATSSLKIRSFDTSNDPVVIAVVNGAAQVTKGSGAAQTLTSGSVSVSGITFTRTYTLATSSAFGADAVSYSFTMSENTSNTTKAYSKVFQSSATVSAPVPKIALVQQATGGSSAAGVTSTAATFSYNTATGSLVIAVASHVGTTTDSITLSDTASSTWTKILDVTSSALTEHLAIFDLLNASNVSDTVTAAFSVGVSNPTLHIFEYRGAATSASLDVTSTQSQSNVTSFSSGSATPTTSPELLFGALYLSALPSGGASSGIAYTMEASSTISNMSIEDQNTYVTGAVSATWTTSAAESSTAAMATFK